MTTSRGTWAGRAGSVGSCNPGTTSFSCSGKVGRRTRRTITGLPYRIERCRPSFSTRSASDRVSFTDPGDILCTIRARVVTGGSNDTRQEDAFDRNGVSVQCCSRCADIGRFAGRNDYRSEWRGNSRGESDSHECSDWRETGSVELRCGPVSLSCTARVALYRHGREGGLPEAQSSEHRNPRRAAAGYGPAFGSRRSAADGGSDCGGAVARNVESGARTEPVAEVHGQSSPLFRRHPKSTSVCELHARRHE